MARGGVHVCERPPLPFPTPILSRAFEQHTQIIDESRWGARDALPNLAHRN